MTRLWLTAGFIGIMHWSASCGSDSGGGSSGGSNALPYSGSCHYTKDSVYQRCSDFFVVDGLYSAEESEAFCGEQATSNPDKVVEWKAEKCPRDYKGCSYAKITSDGTEHPTQVIFDYVLSSSSTDCEAVLARY